MSQTRAGKLRLAAKFRGDHHKRALQQTAGGKILKERGVGTVESAAGGFHRISQVVVSGHG